MKGMEMPVMFMIAIILGLITVVGVMLFLNNSVSKNDDVIDLIKRHSELCQVYGDARCVEKNVAPKYQPGFAQNLTELCKALNYIKQDEFCMDFDVDCGRVCCKSCPPLAG